MDSITFLSRFGFDPDQFEPSTFEPELVDGNWVYRAVMRSDLRRCPTCGKSDAAVVKERSVATVKCRLADGPGDLLYVEKVRFFCRRCGRTFTPKLKGVRRYAKHSDASIAAVIEAFYRKETFRSIAARFGIDEGYAIKLFDSHFKTVPARPLPRVLCIDEVCFRNRIEGKYPAVLYDFERREVVEVVRSRQKKWLETWFANVPEWQRRNVRYYVSDMYDEYARVCKKYLPNALHVVDLFHVIKQLGDAVKQLRANAMNSQPRDTMEYAFMKSKWKLFQIRETRIGARYYTHKGTGVVYPVHEALLNCLKTSAALWEGWSSMQELYRWHVYDTFAEAVAFVERVANRLIGTGSPHLERVGRTYLHWKIQIANGLARNQTGCRFSNGVAEGLNNQIKTLKKISNGCLNFDRFRKRILIVLTYAKKDPLQ